ncbi:MAG: hypothetical protein FWG14_10460, partial [Peptococcaceae bacterium]|nr:hypothetical protein [Peptococcaceae bacterium]
QHSALLWTPYKERSHPNSKSKRPPRLNRSPLLNRLTLLTLFTVILTMFPLLSAIPSASAALEDNSDRYYKPFQDSTPNDNYTPNTTPTTPVTPTPDTPKTDNKKTLPELEQELAAKKQDLHALVTRNAAQAQMGTLYSALTLADVQREAATQRPEAVAETLNVMSIFSATGWIPLAVCAAAGLLLFVGVFRLMRRIIRGSMKEDFIK